MINDGDTGDTRKIGDSIKSYIKPLAYQCISSKFYATFNTQTPEKQNPKKLNLMMQ